MGRILASSRLLIAGAVLGTYLSAVALIVYGVLSVVNIVIETIEEESLGASGAKKLAVDLIELTDLFLLGTVLYIVALGLYQLFIDPNVPTPARLKIRSLDDLKERLVSVIIVLLAVTFLGDLVRWQNAREILYLGIGTSLVMVGLGFFLLLPRLGHSAEAPSVAEAADPTDSTSSEDGHR